MKRSRVKHKASDQIEIEREMIMKSCCNKRHLYVETDPIYSGENCGDYVVMCSNCGWIDKWVYFSFDRASDRIDELEKRGYNESFISRMSKASC